MELEVGMYVRTNDGYINKIKEVNQYNVLVDARDLFGEELNIPNNEIVKASHNIVILIEVGDYVNGHQVLGVERFRVEVESNSIEAETWETIESYEIETVVTKEQFESMQYRIGV